MNASNDLTIEVRRTVRTQNIRRQVAASVPILPSVALFAIFLLGPIVYALWGSLTNRELTGSRAVSFDFIGLANYVDVLSDPLTWRSFGLTVIFILGSAVIGQNTIGMGVALGLEEAHKPIQGLVKIAVVAAWVLPEIVAAYIMYAFFSKGGTWSSIMGGLGFSEGSWLFAYPMIAVILANIWRGSAFSMMIYGAALSSVDPTVYEAATMDGAGWWRRTFSIALPIIKGAIITNLMLITLQTLASFTLIFVMTAGGPGNDTTTLPILAYQEAFKFGALGKGTAISVVLLVLGAVASVVYIKTLGHKDR